MKFWQFFCIFLVLFCWLIINPSKVAATDQKYSLRYETVYNVRQDGTTAVIQDFHLTNLTSDFFAQEYVVGIGNAEIYNLSAQDASGVLPIERRKDGNNLSGRVQLRSPAVGEGKTAEWIVTYETLEIASKKGRLWEITIPPPSDYGVNADFTIKVFVPSSFGSPVIQKPQPTTANIWDKNSATKGISLVYSAFPTEKPYQTVDFNLRYQLYNNKLYPVTTTITLPADTSYQKIFLTSLTPQPQDVETDADGNWIAKYYLGSAARLEITATGSAAIFSTPSIPSLGTVDPNDFLKDDKYWEVNDPIIMLKARQLGNPQAIFSYVVSRLNFDKNPKNPARLGAKKALLGANAVSSQEFTDLFIALSRAAGIPAREVNGVIAPVVTLHSWPEYYDFKTKEWLMVDPSWTALTKQDYATVFDFSHLSFAIHGKSSTTPPAAGTFINDPKAKLVSVTFSQSSLDVSEIPKLSLKTDIPDKATAGFDILGRVFLDNIGQTVHPGEKLLVSSPNLDVVAPIVISGILPPFSKRELDVKVRPIRWFEETDGIINLNIAYETRTYFVRILPIYRSSFVIVLGGLTIVGLIAIIAQIAGSLFNERFPRQNNLRRQS